MLLGKSNHHCHQYCIVVVITPIVKILFITQDFIKEIEFIPDLMAELFSKIIEFWDSKNNTQRAQLFSTLTNQVFE
jgi:hypothetical protein